MAGGHNVQVTRFIQLGICNRMRASLTQSPKPLRMSLLGNIASSRSITHHACVDQVPDSMPVLQQPTSHGARLAEGETRRIGMRPWPPTCTPPLQQTGRDSVYATHQSCRIAVRGWVGCMHVQQCRVTARTEVCSAASKYSAGHQTTDEADQQSHLPYHRGNATTSRMLLVPDR